MSPEAWFFLAVSLVLAALNAALVLSWQRSDKRLFAMWRESIDGWRDTLQAWEHYSLSDERAELLRVLRERLER